MSPDFSVSIINVPLLLNVVMFPAIVTVHAGLAFLILLILATAGMGEDSFIT